MLVPRVRPGTFSDMYLLSEEKEHMVSYLGTSPSDLKVTRFPVSALHSLISRSHGFLSGNFTLSSQGHTVSSLGTSPSDLKVPHQRFQTLGEKSSPKRQRRELPALGVRERPKLRSRAKVLEKPRPRDCLIFTLLPSTTSHPPPYSKYSGLSSPRQQRSPS